MDRRRSSTASTSSSMSGFCSGQDSEKAQAYYRRKLNGGTSAGNPSHGPADANLAGDAAVQNPSFSSPSRSPTLAAAAVDQGLGAEQQSAAGDAAHQISSADSGRSWKPQRSPQGYAMIPPASPEQHEALPKHTLWDTSHSASHTAEQPKQPTDASDRAGHLYEDVHWMEADGHSDDGAGGALFPGGGESLDDEDEDLLPLLAKKKHEGKGSKTRSLQYAGMWCHVGITYLLTTRPGMQVVHMPFTVT